MGAVGSEHVHELRLERFGLAVHPRVAHHDATVGGDREVAHVLTAVTTGERADRLAAGLQPGDEEPHAADHERAVPIDGEREGIRRKVSPGPRPRHRSSCGV